MGYDERMRLRTKLAIGVSFTIGYYFGAKAGRERYVQLRRGLDAVPFGKALEKGQALVELCVERVSSLRGSRGAVANGSDGAASPVSSIRSAGSAPV
jgi:hypothetical protein